MTCPRSVFLVVALASSACASASAPSRGPSDDRSLLRREEAVLVFVTETFTEGQRVKSDGDDALRARLGLMVPSWP